jgi:hypothetical protein
VVLLRRLDDNYHVAYRVRKISSINVARGNAHTRTRVRDPAIIIYGDPLLRETSWLVNLGDTMEKKGRASQSSESREMN